MAAILSYPNVLKQLFRFLQDSPAKYHFQWINPLYPDIF